MLDFFIVFARLVLKILIICKSQEILYGFHCSSVPRALSNGTSPVRSIQLVFFYYHWMASRKGRFYWWRNIRWVRKWGYTNNRKFLRLESFTVDRNLKCIYSIYLIELHFCIFLCYLLELKSFFSFSFLLTWAPLTRL